MYKKIIDKYKNVSERSQLALKNILGSLVLKFVNILTSLLIVPLTINYINPTQYGIWMTVSSIVGWITFFDLGLANGFRNKFAEAKAKGDVILARKYVSTTYFIITLILVIVLSIILLVNDNISWSEILKVDEKYSEELRQIFAILSCFFCVNMIAGVFGKLLYADQKPALSNLLTSIGQLFSLLSIYILTRCTIGNLTNLAFYFAGVPAFTLFISSIIMFLFTRYKIYRPSLKFIKLSLIKDIMGMGFKFFMIYLCLIVVFQLMNIVLSREIGPQSVTEYNIANKYFSVIYMISVIIVTPFWSAFTDAYVKKDYYWMKNVLKKLEYLIIACFLISFLMLIISPYVYKLWLGNSVEIAWEMSIAVMIFILMQISGSVYMNLINGVGCVFLQFIIYLIFAIISFPLMTYACREYGAIGIVVVPSIVYLVQAIFGRVQIKKIINDNASGFWLK